ncbi:Hypothetical predicted protein [Marmota monax]|uniref:Uncharacterized protein n=1 Tax=Marmota monax TaxID=9995 RepID=A0A5E4CG78_MARMO|nr:hypothetical protein GHT09_008681 [Marmota monax]VTJ80129.1 Hypothetical predicted protein [Marmota monax]
MTNPSNFQRLQTPKLYLVSTPTAPGGARESDHQPEGAAHHTEGTSPRIPPGLQVPETRRTNLSQVPRRLSVDATKLGTGDGSARHEGSLNWSDGCVRPPPECGPWEPARWEGRQRRGGVLDPGGGGGGCGRGRWEEPRGSGSPG